MDVVTKALVDQFERLSRLTSQLAVSLDKRISRIEGELWPKPVVPPLAAPVPAQKRMTFAIDGFIQKDGGRTIRGIASTASIDRAGDSVNPLGCRWKLPIPLLRGHDHSRVVGRLDNVHLSARGVEITATVASGIPDADESWRLIQQKALQSFSIGFKPLQSTPMQDGGTRFDLWELLELSVVSVPCNSDAVIQEVA